MRFTNFLILGSLLTTAAHAREVEIVIDSGKPIRTIYIPPNEPKILVLPGDVSYCYNSTKFLRTAIADAVKLNDNENWFREIAVATNLASITNENYKDVESAEYVLRCKFLSKDGQYTTARIPVRIDSYNRYKDEETYVFSESGKSLLDRALKDRIKSYGQIEIQGDKLIIPSIAAEKTSAPTEKGPQKHKPGKKGPDTIKGFKPLTIGS